MGMIDRIKSGLGLGPGQQSGRTRKKEKGAEIDTRDRVNISGKKSDQDQGNLISPGKIPSGKKESPVQQADPTVQQLETAEKPKSPRIKVNAGPNNPTNIAMIDDPVKPASPAVAPKNNLKDTIHRMTAIARAVGGDFKMDVEEGQGWAYNFQTNSITYPKKDLIDKHPDYALGVILHESAHRRYSRWFVEPDLEENEPFLFLNNAVEDPRVNNIQVSRFAGAKDFFKKIYDEDLFQPEFGSDMMKQIVEGMVQEGVSRKDAEKAVKKMGVKIPRHIQYGLGLIYDWYTEGKTDPRIKDKNVKKALKETAPVFREAFGLRRDIMTKDLTPAEINKQAMESYQTVRDKLWPVYQKLVEEDKNSLADGLSGGSKGGKSGKSGKQGQSGQSGGSSGSQGSQQQQGGGAGGAGGAQQQDQKPGDQQNAGGAGGAQQQDQKPGDQQNAGGAGDKQGDDKKDAKGAGGAGQQDKDKKPEQGAGAGEGKMDPEKAREIAEKVIENLDRQLNGQKFEEKDQNARRDNRQGGNQSNQAGQQGNQAGKQGQQGNQAGKQGQQGNQAGQQGNQAGQPGGDGQKSKGQGDDAKGGGQGGQTSDIDLPSLEDLLQRKMEIEARNEAMQSPYDRYVYDTCDFSDEFSGELKNFIHEQERPRYAGNFRTGKKLNLRRAMQSEAKYQLTGEFDDEIWLRRENPQKRDHQFIFVLDESGSMRGGEKWENALKGLVLCQEALDDLEIDFGVIGFSDNPQIHKKLEDKFDENFKDNELNQIMNSASGGTNDADAVQIALNMLKHQDPEKQKTIIVITDGEGKTEEMKKLIEEAEEAGIRIVGVGIGEGTSAVEKVYKDKVKVDRIAQLPTELSDIIREQVEDSYSSS
ncbi:MAG: VWA domain-containing protein [Candidatus Eremiobacteraeota bacterium]|nr:VWA domain-containing protein [Candidatus Eremiobacteraeota bacterium]